MKIARTARAVALFALAWMALVHTPHQASGEQTAVKTPAGKCDRAKFQTVLDVGHTLQEPGAISARGATEYEFNLRLAGLIERTLIAAGFPKTVLLITDGPTLPGLMKRVASANKLGADLFLSIHHDSVPERLLEKWTFESAEHRFSDRFKGHSLFVSFEHPQLKASLQFGKLLGKEMKNFGLQYTPHYTDKIMGGRRRELVDKEAGIYRFDQLVVLKMTQMPAVLLEAGSIINRDEELLMGTPAQQEKIAAAVSNAVTEFCELRAPGKAARTGGARK